ncbi:hypothetical protein CHUAL_000658 [Chamberlinius hualienensis]
MALFFERLSRRKYFSTETLADSNLKRCLTVIDLTALGVGSTLGLGIYVLAGQVAKDDAGPAVVVSFFIAAVASAIAGICYAEFGSRVPRAGSAYVYSYVTVGEFVGFVIGWNLILEYVIGAASVARGYSGYFDSLIGGRMSDAFRNAMPIYAKGIADYPDFFAFGMTLGLAFVLALGVKESTKVNNVLTVVNLTVVAYVIICGAFKSDTYNWKIPESEIPFGVDAGKGGFFPYGISGVMAGAATCFYGFVGFDAIATTGEEAKNPQRDIPVAIVISLLIIFFAYCGISIVITLMVPYYMQDGQAPIPVAFDKVGWPVAKWIVSIGALFGLSTSLLGAMFPLPRVLYAMSNDGLIFRWLSKISPTFKTPFIATIIAGAFAAVMALIFDVDALVDMMSIGTLLAYTLVAASVLILRYRPNEMKAINEDGNNTELRDGDSEQEEKSSFFRQLFNLDKNTKPSLLSSSIATWTTLVMAIFEVGFNCFLIFAADSLSNKDAWSITCIIVFGVAVVLCMVIIGLQPSNNSKVAFMVPWVPVIPSLSILVNTQLMLKLSIATWVRFAIWLAVGLLIYFLYGMWNSTEEYARRGLVPPNINADVFERIEKDRLKKEAKKLNNKAKMELVPSDPTPYPQHELDSGRGSDAGCENPAFDNKKLA